jgi:hypothetical protein
MIKIQKRMKKLSHIFVKLFIFIVIVTGCSEAPSSSDILTIDIVPQKYKEKIYFYQVRNLAASGEKNINKIIIH